MKNLNPSIILEKMLEMSKTSIKESSTSTMLLPLDALCLKKYFLPSFFQHKEKGHFERLESVSHKYIYVDNDRPSGIEGAYVVSEEEATGG